YTPADIPVKAREAGLGTVGIMDHDSVSGCAEFLDAAKVIGIAATAGCETRVNMDGTSMKGRKTNNPDEPNISYIALHGIPRNKFDAVVEFLKPAHETRIARDRKEVEKLNEILAIRGAPTLDFDIDVMSISEAVNGGSITERHILYALSLKLINAFGKGERLIGFVEERMGTPIPEQLKELLLDLDNPHYAYDLLGVFKASLVPLFFLPSSHEECMNVRDAVQFASSIGAIPAYAYLGDVDESPTGDKKAEKFEDDFLDELVPELKAIGFKAITYMPPRNTREQLKRLQKLCKENELMEISGVDINSSRQSFNCPVLLEPDFVHLADAAYALIAHEKLAAEDSILGIFHPENPKNFKTLEERIAFYADIGRRMDHTQPEKAVELI
ncbi:MAG: PHP domain-containing protein, partial [Kiritimatiellaceae bacterium]|nr:PHP domain-containing protein [Kiritimatiellaceae bacterium]